jgi:hypothetical protein
MRSGLVRFAAQERADQSPGAGIENAQRYAAGSHNLEPDLRVVLSRGLLGGESDVLGTIDGFQVCQASLCANIRSREGNVQEKSVFRRYAVNHRC